MRGHGEVILACTILPPPVAPAHAPLAVLRGKTWEPGQTLRIRFLGGTRARRGAVLAAAATWSAAANVGFREAARGEAEIRVAFDPNRGNWSYLGTDARLVPPDAPTLNLATPDRAVCLHELGHALGCGHEHQHPEGGIPWARPAVYRYYAETQGWGAAMVDSQVFATYSHNHIVGDEYDPKSVMHYPIPPELLADPSRAVGWNNRLSRGDRAAIGRAYPGEG